jgi:adhesin/invasin
MGLGAWVATMGVTQAAEPTALVFADDTADVAEYSQSVALAVALRDVEGAPLDGTVACGDGPCRVTLVMQAEDGSGDRVAITAPDVVVDASGVARARVRLVDGEHGGAAFVASATGVPYTVTARFAGAGTPLPDADDLDCAGGAAGTADGRLCPTTTTHTLTLLRETPSLSFGADLDFTVGDAVTLAVTLVDDNGDALGTDVDGPGPKVLAGLPVRFAYDVNADRDPAFQGGELLGEATTNAFGVAAFEFTADPSFVTAGAFSEGIFAEFPGDARYGIARTSVSIVVRALGPAPQNTIVSVSPDTLTADGSDTTDITVKLVDADNNLLGPDAPPHDVVVTADLGRLGDDVERDPIDGFYRTTLRASRQPGTATVSVTVDGVTAGGVRVEFVGEGGGCSCGALPPPASSASSSSSPGAVPVADVVFVVVVGAALFAFARVRRREVSRG